MNLSKDFEIVAGVLSKYYGAATDVVIPDGVIEIAPDSFTGLATITSVLIPDSVERIGIPLGNGVFTDSAPFKRCTNLRKVNIPDNVSFIMQGSFSFCENLNEINISTEKILSLNPEGLCSIFGGSPAWEDISQRLKQESARRGICWSCRKPLDLKKNGKCKNCGARGHLI